MKKIGVIVKKEVIDNLRDKRSFFFALIYGPVFIPLFIAGSIIFGFKEGVINFEADTEIAVVGASVAPNLIQFLKQNNITARDAEPGFRDNIRQNERRLVLEIPSDFGDKFTQGQPAPVVIYYNQADKKSAKLFRQVKIMIEQYKHKIMHARFHVRGFDTGLLDPVVVVAHDLSSEGMSGQLFGTMLPMIMILTMLMGGMYLAVDSTAGERERHSLEPLLTLPISRAQLVLGKYFSIFIFVFVSGLLATINLYLVFTFMPVEELRAAFRFDAITFAKAFLLASPVSLLITSLLAVVSAYTKSTKEAQTHLGVAMIFPMVPFFLLQFFKVKTALGLMFIPILSQYKLIEKIIKDEDISISIIAASISGTLLAAMVLLLLTMWFYQRERILD